MINSASKILQLGQLNSNQQPKPSTLNRQLDSNNSLQPADQTFMT